MNTFKQFKKLVDNGVSPLAAAEELGLSPDEFNDVIIAYHDEAAYSAQYAELEGDDEEEEVDTLDFDSDDSGWDPDLNLDVDLGGC